MNPVDDALVMVHVQCRTCHHEWDVNGPEYNTDPWRRKISSSFVKKVERGVLIQLGYMRKGNKRRYSQRALLKWMLHRNKTMTKRISRDILASMHKYAMIDIVGTGPDAMVSLAEE